jgi:hypothetical protein
LLVELGQVHFERLERRVELGPTLLDVGQSRGGLLVLLLGGGGFLAERVAIGGELLASFAGGGELESALGQRVGGGGLGLSTLGQFVVGRGERVAAGGKLEVEFVDLGVELDELFPKRPELTASRDQPGRLLPWPDQQRAVGAEHLGGERDERHPGMGRRKLDSPIEILDDPRRGEQPLDQRSEPVVALDESIGPTVDSRQAGKIGRLR